MYEGCAQAGSAGRQPVAQVLTSDVRSPPRPTKPAIPKTKPACDHTRQPVAQVLTPDVRSFPCAQPSRQLPSRPVTKQRAIGLRSGPAAQQLQVYCPKRCSISLLVGAMLWRLARSPNIFAQLVVAAVVDNSACALVLLVVVFLIGPMAMRGMSLQPAGPKMFAVLSSIARGLFRHRVAQIVLINAICCDVVLAGSEGRHMPAWPQRLWSRPAYPQSIGPHMRSGEVVDTACFVTERLLTRVLGSAAGSWSAKRASCTAVAMLRPLMLFSPGVGPTLSISLLVGAPL